MLKPRIFLCSVPVFHAFRNVNNISRPECNSRFPPFLIPPFPRNADEYLTRPVVDMPVVATPGLKCYVVHRQNTLFPLSEVLGRKRCEITVSYKIPCIGSISRAFRKRQFGDTVALCFIVRPYFFGLIKCCPSLGPTGIERNMRDYLGYLCAGDTFFFASRRW